MRVSRILALTLLASLVSQACVEAKSKKSNDDKSSPRQRGRERNRKAQVSLESDENDGLEGIVDLSFIRNNLKKKASELVEKIPLINPPAVPAVDPEMELSGSLWKNNNNKKKKNKNKKKKNKNKKKKKNRKNTNKKNKKNKKIGKVGETLRNLGSSLLNRALELTGNLPNMLPGPPQ